MALNVLVIEEAPTLGGSMTSIEVVIRHGLAKGIQFGLMSQVDFGDFLPQEVKRHFFPKQTSSSARNALLQTLKTVSVLKNNQYDVVILNNILSANYPSLLAALLRRVPTIQFVRAYERRATSWNWLKNRVDAIIAVSHSVKHRLVELGATESSITLAYEGIEKKPLTTTEERQASRRRWNLPMDAQIFGFVGRLVPWKGFELFTEAAIRAALQNPRFIAVIVGGSPPSQAKRIEALKHKITQHQLEKRILWLGEVAPETVISIIQGLDLFVHTSTEPEPFGRVLLEAMAVGIPTLSSSEGGPREILTHQQDGLLSPSGNIEALTEMIEAFFKSGDAKKLGLAGQETVRRRFTEEVCAEPVLQLIQQLSM